LYLKKRYWRCTENRVEKIPVPNGCSRPVVPFRPVTVSAYMSDISVSYTIYLSGQVTDCTNCYARTHV